MTPVTTRTVTLANGLHIPYAETSDPTGVPVVFVHAYVESWRYFEGVLARLPASLHGYAPTQRGHGDASRPPDGYRPEDFAADIVGFMDTVGIRRAVLVGTSSGGLVSQFVASSRPDRVLALVLISTPASLANKPAVTAIWDEVSDLEDPLDPAFVDHFVRSTSPEAVPDEFLAVLVSESLKVPARVWKQTLRGLIAADSSVIMNRITAPTLLIWGDEDALVSEDQQIIRGALQDARLKVYKGVGHAVHLAYPDRIVDDLIEFVAQTVSTTSS